KHGSGDGFMMPPRNGAPVARAALGPSGRGMHAYAQRADPQQKRPQRRCPSRSCPRLAAAGTRRYKPPQTKPIPATPSKPPMPIERTFSIIKPDATARNLSGAIHAMIEQAGLRIVAQKRVRITRTQAETFYAVHKARPFFAELVDFMISGPVVVQVLEGDNAIIRYRDVMGATDPAKAASGTIRKVHAKSIGENSVHGSDAPETAEKEIAQFFAGNEIVG